MCLRRMAAVLVSMLLGLCAHGCDGSSTVAPEGCPISTSIPYVWTLSSVDKVDLLFVIDNSRSMAEKQAILAESLPELVTGLANPPCLDAKGELAPQQPAGPAQDCPDQGSARSFAPVVDMHVGVITSSIGGHGSDACTAETVASEDDQGHLIARSGTGVGDPPVPTYEDAGFLVWDPLTDSPSHSPQGQDDPDALVAALGTMVRGAGQVGCGYEAPLEAWYRFLVHPDPYEEIEIVDNKATLVGTDQVLLEQRRSFLRPDSLLVIAMLSDENDCSIRDGGQFYYAAQIYQPGSSNPYHLPKPRAACATDPNNACCRSCGQGAAEGCSTANDDCDGSLSNLDDNINLRCFDQKRRFGIDFLWPIDRYLTGLTAPQVSDREGNVVQNPMFTDLDPTDSNSTIRDASLVFVAGIVGVPWQDIARRDASDQPDLASGANGAGEPVGGLQSGLELEQNGTWAIILGDPATYLPPLDPLMIESVEPRTGQNPVTGDPIEPPDAGLMANPINGHERSIVARDDLQYACIFPLQQPLDCSKPQVACDCGEAYHDNPLCQDTSGAYGQVQRYAKAYPALRQLQLLKEMRTQGIVGSICPAQRADQHQLDFGYRPAMAAILERVSFSLGTSCLGRSLTPDDEGRVPCRIVEARSAEVCDCNANGRAPIEPTDPIVSQAKQNPRCGVMDCNCLCEIVQTAGDDLEACQNDPSPAPANANGETVHGWCYIDATTVAPTGNPDLVALCPEAARRTIRYLGGAKDSHGGWRIVRCPEDVAGSGGSGC